MTSLKHDGRVQLHLSWRRTWQNAIEMSDRGEVRGRATESPAAPLGAEMGTAASGEGLSSCAANRSITLLQ